MTLSWIRPRAASGFVSYNDLWAAGYVLHCTDIEDGEVVVPTVDRLREIGDVLHDICDGLLEPDEADARPRR